MPREFATSLLGLNPDRQTDWAAAFFSNAEPGWNGRIPLWTIRIAIRQTGFEGLRDRPLSNRLGVGLGPRRDFANALPC